MRKLNFFMWSLILVFFISTGCDAEDKSNRSPGCGSAAPGVPPTSIKVDGRTREFISVVPKSYESSVPHRLIFAFHGRTTPNDRVRQYYRIEHNPKDDLVPVARGMEARDWALAQNELKPPGRSCEPGDLNCECYGPPDTPNPVVWCPHTEDLNRRGKFYPHLWPREAGAAIMNFFDSLPASAP